MATIFPSARDVYTPKMDLLDYNLAEHLNDLQDAVMAIENEHDNLAIVHAATSKTTPVDADEIGIWDSATSALKKLTWANLKATLGSGSGDVVGPASAVGDNIAAFDGTTGKLIKDGLSKISDLVTKALFDAQTILAATSDNTPAALTVAEQTLVGRITGGNIAALSAAQVRTLLSLVIGTNVQAWDADLDTWATKTAPTGTVVGTSDTQTLTAKRVTPRITVISSSATPTINTDNCDFVDITALATDITSMTTNLSGTPTNGQKLIIRFKDNATARAITWGASFEALGVALPTTTVSNKRLTVGFIYDTTTSKWGCVAKAQEA